MSRFRSIYRASAVLLVAAWTMALPGFAQPADSEAGEVSARGGVTFGGGSPGMGWQPTVAGSTGVAFSKYGMLLIDTAFMPLSSHTIQGWPERATVNRSYLFDFGIDFHIRIPVKERIAPYAIAGTGLLWNMVRQQTVDADRIPVVRRYNQFNGALHTGGGVRFYINENWGLRPELKVIVSKQVYTTVSMGVFYVLPSNWP
jgi:hypothetical protein